MKKEKNSVSPASQAKSGLSISVVNNVNKTSLEGEGGGGGGTSPPPIKSDPDAPQNPLVNGENNVSSNNCDNSTPGTPTGGGQGDPPEVRDRDRDTPSSLEDKKPVLSGSGGGGSGPPSNCNTGNGVIKSETDTFLDTFDTKDGGKSYKNYSIIHENSTKSSIS